MTKIFRPYQKEAFKYYLRVNNPLAFLEMRLGKTLITIRWTNTILSKGNILVVSPYSALFGWEYELVDEGEDFIYKVIGTQRQRKKILENYKDKPDELIYYLVNPTFYRSIPQLAKLNWKILILDEPTFLRNFRTGITEFYWHNFGHVPFKAGLTGLPAPEGDHEYYCICKIIEPESFIEKDYWAFEHRNFGILPNHKRITNARGGSYISGRLAKYAYFLSRKDVNLGGEAIREIKYCFMPSKTRAIYNKVEKEFLLEYEDIEKTTIFSVTKYLWCRRLCSGMIEKEIVDKSKVTLLLELIKGELLNQQIVIWFHFNDEIEYIESILNQEGFSVRSIFGSKTPSKREEIRLNFQAGMFQFLLCQIKCFQFGSDLSAAETMIYHSLTESLLNYTQTESRPFDLSKGNSVLILYLICENSVDESIYKSVMKKEGKALMMRRIVQDMQRRQYGKMSIS